MKIEFISQQRETLLFLITNMAAMTSHGNQQYIFFEVKCTMMSNCHHLLTVTAKNYIKNHAFLFYSITQTVHLEVMTTMFFQCGNRVLLARMLLFLYWMMVSHNAIHVTYIL